MKETKGFFHKVPTGYCVKGIVKEIKGSFHKVPTGLMGGYFSKILGMCPVGIGWANCFRTHHELTMYPLGKCPLAPSGSRLNSGEVYPVIENLVLRMERAEGDHDALPEFYNSDAIFSFAIRAHIFSLRQTEVRIAKTSS